MSRRHTERKDIFYTYGEAIECISDRRASARRVPDKVSKITKQLSMKDRRGRRKTDWEENFE
jgi:hypothetical protein